MDKTNDKDLQLVSLGTKSRPLPIWDRKAHKGGALMGAKGKISFYTQRTDMEGIDVGERIYAELMRNYPSRGMIENLIHELNSRDPNRTDRTKNSFVSGYVGGPGVGKSFLFKLMGKLVHPQGALYLNCKGVDLGSIFSETIFDTSDSMEERSMIDARILQHNSGQKLFKPESIELLKSALGSALAKGEDRDLKQLSIDWSSLKVKGTTTDEQEYQAKVISQILRQVCQNEGIETSEGGLSIGITTRDGIAIRALDKNSADYGRPVLLDELNADSDDDSSDEKLFEFIAFLSDPKIDSITLTGGQNRQVTFNREDIPATFRLNFTANPNAKGMNRGGFDRALMSRFGAQLDIRTVPDADETDYADRIAGYLTGSPLMQIYATGWKENGDNLFKSSPELLISAAKNIRGKALTAKEERLLYNSNGQEEAQNIEIAPKIIEFSNQLASFFDQLNDLLNPNSDFFEASGIDISPEYEEYLNEIQIDLRLVTKLIEKANSIVPEAETDNIEEIARAFSGAFGQSDEELDDDDFGDLLADRGKRLEKFIIQWLKDVIIPADAKTRDINVKECQDVLNLALKEAADNGIGTREQNDSAKGQVKRLHTLFDIDRFETMSEQMRIVRDVVVDNVLSEINQLRAEDKSIPDLSSDPDKIMSLEDWKYFSAQADKIEQKEDEILIVQPDMDHVSDNPFGNAYVIDSATIDEDIDFSDLVERDGILLPMAMNSLERRTLTQIWTEIGKSSALGTSEAEKIAVNQSKGDLGLVSLLVQNSGKPDIVHLLKGLDKTVLVSSSDNDDLKELLKRQDIVHIDYTQKSAAHKINALVSESLSPKNIKTLKSSFLARNGLEENHETDIKKTLGELMTDVKNIPPIAPIYVTTKKLGK